MPVCEGPAGHSMDNLTFPHVKLGLSSPFTALDKYSTDSRLLKVMSSENYRNLYIYIILRCLRRVICCTILL